MTKAPSIKEALEYVEMADNRLECDCNKCVDVARSYLAEAKTALATLSPPAGERREAIARIIDPVAIDNIGDLARRRRRKALDKADALIASGLVQDEATIRKDEREKCAKIADDASDNSDKASNTYDGGSGSLGYESACTDIAAAIRSARDGGAES